MPLSPELAELAARVSNRGRWGDDDQRGTLNLIDSAAVHRGVSAARQGRTFSLAIPFDRTGPQFGSIPGRTNPELELVQVNVSLTGDAEDFTSSDDRFSMGVQAATHWDALAHVGYGGELYNGTPQAAVTDDGASRLGIEHFGPVVSRGVLVDVPRLHGVDHFEGPYSITGDDLDRGFATAGLGAEPGDVLCVRTGQMHFRSDPDPSRYHSPTAGIGTESIEWLHDHDIAAVATDNVTFEVFPSPIDGQLLPVHMVLIRDMGLVQGQVWALDELADDCAEDGQYDFLLTASPLPLTGSVGGTVVPTAIK